MSKFRTQTEQAKYWLLAWVSLAQELIVILTGAYITPNWRGKILFSKWMDV